MAYLGRGIENLSDRVVLDAYNCIVLLLVIPY